MKKEKEGECRATQENEEKAESEQAGAGGSNSFVKPRLK